MSQVLLVDDEPVLREVLGTLLRRNGHQVIETATAADANAAFLEEEIDVALLDLMLPDGNGLDVLREIKAASPETEVVIITAFSSIEGAIEAMREGAFHYIPKPFKNDEVLLTVRRALEQQQLRAENRALRAELDERFGLGNLVGRSDGMRRAFELIRLVSQSNSHLIVEGEAGTGKELVARTIHHNSRRSRKPFVVVDTASLSEDAVMETLFGSDRANRPQSGVIESAAGGTLYLSELTDLPLAAQQELLPLLHEGQLELRGKKRKIDVRVICGTKGNLAELATDKKVDNALWNELRHVTISLPPLRRRLDDLPILARHFADRAAHDANGTSPSISRGAMRRLLESSWPGNVAELEQVITQAVHAATSDELDENTLPVDGSPSGRSTSSGRATSPSLPPEGVSFKDTVREYERQMILRALTLAGGVQKRAAELLRIKPTTLNEMIKRLGIPTGNGSGEGRRSTGARSV